MDSLKIKKLVKDAGKPIPLYRQIISHLSERIESGAISEGQRLPSISKMVRIWDVEYGTVKRAITYLEKAGLVKYEGRGKGPLVIKKFPAKKTCTVVFPRRCGNSHFSALTLGMNEYSSSHNVNFLITDSLMSEQNELETINNPPNGTDGMILYPADSPEYRKAVEHAMNSGIKIVFIDRTLPGIKISSVSPDHFDGAYQATTHLLEETKLPVYYFGKIDGSKAYEQRYMGWLEAMHDHNHLDSEKYICDISMKIAPVHRKADQGWRTVEQDNIYNFFKGDFRNVAIMGMNDDAARIAYMTAQHAGFTPGKDVFIAGFGDKPFCEKFPAPLTSVTQEDEKVGYEAVKLLCDSIIHNSNKIVNRILPVKLRIRESSLRKTTPLSGNNQ